MKYRNLLFFVLFISTLPVTAQQITQWRGEGRRGIYPDENLMDVWPEAGPKMVLQLDDIGNGFGAPIITDEFIFITGEINDTAWLFKYTTGGELLWKTDFGADWVKTFPGSRSTPTLVDDLVYVCSGLANLACINAQSGEKIWDVDMIKDLHGQFVMHGHSESPLVYKNTVFLIPGGADTNVVAFDRFSGEIQWVCKGFGERAGYNSPNIIHLPQRDIFVAFTAYHLLGIDANTGELLWSDEQTNIPVEKRGPGAGDTHGNTVLYEDGFIYYFAGDGNCAVKLRLSQNGEQITRVWQNGDVDNFMGGVVKIGDYFYSTTASGRDIRSIQIEDGACADTLKIGSGTLIAADNKLFYYSQKGKMNLIGINDGEMELLSTFKIDFGTKEHFSHPVIADGVLYLRRGPVLRAWDIKE